MKTIATAFLLLSLVGCRIQMNKTIMSNYGANATQESLSEGTQAADKEFGDIQPSLSTAVGPAAKSDLSK